MASVPLPKESLTYVLEDIGLLGLVLRTVSDNLQKENEDGVLDVQKLQHIVLQLTSLFKKCKEDLYAIIGKTIHLIDGTNNTLDKNVFKDIVDELDKCRTLNLAGKYNQTDKDQSNTPISGSPSCSRLGNHIAKMQEMHHKSTNTTKSHLLDEPDDDIFIDCSFREVYNSFIDKVLTENYDSDGLEPVGDKVLFIASADEIFPKTADTSSAPVDSNPGLQSFEPCVNPEDNRPGSPWSVATEKIIASDGEADESQIANLNDFEDEPMCDDNREEGNNQILSISDSDETDIDCTQPFNCTTQANNSVSVANCENIKINTIDTNEQTISNKIPYNVKSKEELISNINNMDEVLTGEKNTIDLDCDELRNTSAKDSNSTIQENIPNTTKHTENCNLSYENSVINITGPDKESSNLDLRPVIGNIESDDDVIESLERILSELEGEKQGEDKKNADENDLIDVTMVEILNNSFSEEENEKSKQNLQDNHSESITQTNQDEPSNIKQEPKNYEEQEEDEPDLNLADQLIKEIEDLSDDSDTLSDSDSLSSSSSVISISSDAVEDLIQDRSELSEEEPHIDSKYTLLDYLNIRKNKFNQNCYVKLVRCEDDKSVGKNKCISDEDVDRLCNLDTVNKKRKASSSGTSDNEKKVVRRRKRKKCDSLSLRSTDTDSDLEVIEPKANSSNLSVEIDSRLDDFLTNKLLDLKSSTDIESSYEKSGNECNNKNEAKQDIKKTTKKEEFDEMEKRRKSWKNDFLLRGKLPSESDSGDSNKSIHSNRRKHKRNTSKYEYDTDFNLSSSDGDKGPSKRPKNYSSDGSSSSSSSESNAEVEGDSDSASKSNLSNTKGRKNIRNLMSEESLHISTQIANKEERARIQRLEERQKIMETISQCFSNSQSQSSSDSQVDEQQPLILDVEVDTLTPLIKVHPMLSDRLKPHQRDGITFMWESCFESVSQMKKSNGSGCILAHCMGLGKTFQVITLVHTLFAHIEETNIKRVLVVCPLSTVKNWRNEVNIAFKKIPYEKFKVSTIGDRKEKCFKYKIVRQWGRSTKAMLIVGYDCFENLTNETKLSKIGEFAKKEILAALVDPGPDLVICDEGHLLRNNKVLKAIALNKIQTRRRIVLTGTPLQNNLVEYYHMVNFVKPNLLGKFDEFKQNFVNPITNGQYEDSTKDDIKFMKQRTHVLHRQLRKTLQRCEASVLKIYLPKITDYAVFIQLNPLQVELYNKFLDIAQEHRVVNKGKCFLSDFITIQYIGTHPYLLLLADRMHGKKIKETEVISDEYDNNPSASRIGWWKPIISENVAERIDLGNKILFVRAVLEECEKINDKVIIFSQSLSELDLLEHFLKRTTTTNSSWEKKLDYHRIDGTLPPEERASICDDFNDTSNRRLRLLLMSIKVGGLGLNLTGANRIIIMTVNWNPSYDSQSVFRAYRFGQTKQVYVYRLVSLGAMEQKVYQRQVTKLAIAHRVVDKHQIKRHYRSLDLEELYECRPNSDDIRSTPMVPNDSLLAKLILKFPFIHQYHEHQSLLANNPEEDLDELEKKAAWEEFQKQKEEKLASVPVVTGPTFSPLHVLSRNNLNNTNTAKSLANHHTIEISSGNYYIPSCNQQPIKNMQMLPVESITIEDSPKKGDKSSYSIKPTSNTITDGLPTAVGDKNTTDKSFPIYEKTKILTSNTCQDKELPQPANDTNNTSKTVSYLMTGELLSAGNIPSKPNYSKYIASLGSGTKYKQTQKIENQNVSKKLKANQIPCYEIIDEPADLLTSTRPILKECTSNAIQQNHKSGTRWNDVITLD